MWKFYLIFLLLFIKQTICGQTTSICSCEGLVDTDYKGLISIYDKPNGKIKFRIKHDFKNEDYLIFTINKSWQDYFNVTLSYAINGKAVSGWVKKNKYLGTYPRAYSEGVRLYSKPDTSYKVIGIILPENAELAQILNCTNNWTYVRLKIKGQIKKAGWHMRTNAPILIQPVTEWISAGVGEASERCNNKERHQRRSSLIFNRDFL